MKKLQLLFIALLLTGAAMAQAPQAINYQAVARNNAGQALATQTIKVRLSIMSGASSLYSETRTVTTNALGLFNVQIGSPGASNTTGSFTAINWANNIPEIKQIKVELDINNSNALTDMGTRPLSSVPYALAAENTVNIGNTPVSFAAPTSGDFLKFDGTSWVPTPGPRTPAIIPIATNFIGGNGIAPGGGGVPWAFASNAQQTITVVNGQVINASFSFNMRPQTGTSPLIVSVDVCYQQVVGGVPTGAIHAFSNSVYPDYLAQYDQGQFLNYAASGAVKVVTGTTIPFTNQIPPGTYKVFLGIKNKSTTTNLIGETVNGFIQIF
jgi:hypothetical protein